MFEGKKKPSDQGLVAAGDSGGQCAVAAQTDCMDGIDKEAIRSYTAYGGFAPFPLGYYGQSRLEFQDWR